jgi:superfamily II DNA or RNA helicase
MSSGLASVLPASSFLEYAFLRWVLEPAALPGIERCIAAQAEVSVDGHAYRVDYELQGSTRLIAVELDGFEFHGNRHAFSYDRLRQNDLQATGRVIVRFSYDSIRSDTARCVGQLQAVMRLDPLLAQLINPSPTVEPPVMDSDPIYALAAPPRPPDPEPLDKPEHIRLDPLRECQREAFHALANYYRAGGKHAACVMSVGAGKTALGVVAALGLSKTRTLIVTPGSVIRGTFDRALDPEAVRNVLYGLPGGPVIPGARPPRVLVLDRSEMPIHTVTRAALLDAEIIVTNFHSLGRGDESGDLLAKLEPGDIDLIIIDEAHIAAADSYQRLFARLSHSKTLLMSACFQRLDGKPIDADVVYRYRLIDSIQDGHAKNLRVTRFAPDGDQTEYQISHSDGREEYIHGRDAILERLDSRTDLARITAVSDEPIHQVMRAVLTVLDQQRQALEPIKPRVLFSAIGEAHAEQVARIAREHGIPTAHLHYSMGDARIKTILTRYERDSGDLEGIVQLRMLGQGYDLPAISVVVPMRPYGSFNEFYQFVGRGIRVIRAPELAHREQFLDLIYHAELGLDEHVDTIYLENEMDPPVHDPDLAAEPVLDEPTPAHETGPAPGSFPEFTVLFESGTFDQRIVHDVDRLEQRRQERELEAIAQRYAAYAKTNPNPVSFDEFVDVVRRFGE